MANPKTTTMLILLRKNKHNSLNSPRSIGPQISTPALRRKALGCHVALALALGPLCCLPAVAQVDNLQSTSALTPNADPRPAEISDTFHPYLSTTITHDDNLLRLAPNDPTGLAAGGFGDTYKDVTGGIKFERPIGRQLVTGKVELSRVTFDRFDELNYNGKEAEVNWKWALGNHLSGDIGGVYEETIAPFADYHSDQRNLRTHKRDYFNGAYLFHPRWQVRVSFVDEKYNYDLDAQKLSNRKEDISDLGLDYLAPSGSKVGLQLRHLKGSYPDGYFGTLLVNDGYTQDEAKANISWLYSGNTQVTFLGGWARRQHNVFTERDDSGTNGRLVVYWTPLGKVKFTASAWREFAAVESTAINSALNKGGSLEATWSATSKITIDALYKHENRDFDGLVAQAAPGSLEDETNTSSLSISYLPLDKITLSLSAFQDNRDGSPGAGTNSYRSKGLSFNAKVQF